MVQVNKEGNVYLQIFNNDVVSVEIPRNSHLGQLEIIDKGRLQNVDRNLYLASIERAVERKQISTPPPTSVERDFIMKNIKISVPENERKKYIELIERNIDVFAKNDEDLVCANHYKHKIELKFTGPWWSSGLTRYSIS